MMTDAGGFTPSVQCVTCCDAEPMPIIDSLPRRAWLIQDIGPHPSKAGLIRDLSSKLSSMYVCLDRGCLVYDMSTFNYIMKHQFDDELPSETRLRPFEGSSSAHAHG